MTKDLEALIEKCRAYREARKAYDENKDPDQVGPTMMVLSTAKHNYKAAIEYDPSVVEDIAIRLMKAEAIITEMEPLLRSYIYEKYKGLLHVPDMAQAYKQDLEICDLARALTQGE